MFCDRVLLALSYCHCHFTSVAVAVAKLPKAEHSRPFGCNPQALRAATRRDAEPATAPPRHERAGANSATQRLPWRPSSNCTRRIRPHRGLRHTKKLLPSARPTRRPRTPTARGAPRRPGRPCRRTARTRRTWRAAAARRATITAAGPTAPCRSCPLWLRSSETAAYRRTRKHRRRRCNHKQRVRPISAQHQVAGRGLSVRSPLALVTGMRL